VELFAGWVVTNLIYFFKKKNTHTTSVKVKNDVVKDSPRRFLP